MASGWVQVPTTWVADDPATAYPDQLVLEPRPSEWRGPCVAASAGDELQAIAASPTKSARSRRWVMGQDLLQRNPARPPAQGAPPHPSRFRYPSARGTSRRA